MTLKNHPLQHSEFSDQFDFSRKVCVVSGGGGGIGAAVALAYGRAGAHVIVADANVQSAASVAECLRRECGRSTAVALDVRSQASIDAMLDMTEAHYGVPDILFNAAGIISLEPFGSISQSSMESLFGVNVVGLFLLLQSTAERMIRAGVPGVVINVASVAGRCGSPHGLAYAASKAAVISLTQAASQALASKNIRVNAIAPGPIKTQMWRSIQETYGRGQLNLSPEQYDKRAADRNPLGRLGTPEDLIGAVMFLSSTASEYVIGQTLNIDGGAVLN